GHAGREREGPRGIARVPHAVLAELFAAVLPGGAVDDLRRIAADAYLAEGFIQCVARRAARRTEGHRLDAQYVAEDLLALPQPLAQGDPLPVPLQLRAVA